VNRTARRFSLLVATLIAATLLLPAQAVAKSASELKKDLERLKSEVRDAGRAYDKAYWALDATDVRIENTDKRITAAQAELAAARKRLATQVSSMYRGEDVDYLTVLLGSASFDELVTRMEYLQRIGEADAVEIDRIEKLEAQLRTDRAKLAAERKKRAGAVKKLSSEKTALQKRLRGKEAEFEAVRAELAKVRSGGSSSGAKYVPGPNGMVFPVQGAYYYSNTWGASRSGGRRRHQGTDIMAPRGTPCVAVLSGTVTSKENRLGGKTIWLRASNGWTFYYAHLDTYKVRSGRVSAGQVIGTVGDTGNARGGSPHLHFEIHPGGGGAVNPYPYLRAME